MSVIVKRVMWEFTRGGAHEPGIRLEDDRGFFVMRMDECRSIIDRVHDRCDEHERDQRKRVAQ